MEWLRSARVLRLEVGGGEEGGINGGRSDRSYIDMWLLVERLEGVMKAASIGSRNRDRMSTSKSSCASSSSSSLRRCGHKA